MKRMLIKISSAILLGVFTLSIASCSSREKLLILNWGEYISDEVVADFEKEFNCDVVMSLADSNELFYSKVKSGTTAYDIVVPSDYMVEKMVQADLLQPIDFTKVPNYTEDTFLPNVEAMIDSMNEFIPGVDQYFVPYFWGTWGIMYNKKNPEVVKLIEKYQDSNLNPYDLMFNRNVTGNKLKVAMYDSIRHSYSATMLYKGLDINNDIETNLSVAEETLIDANFSLWGTDNLKKGIQAGNLDLAYVWTGDYLDMMYIDAEAGKDVKNLSYDILIPDQTIAFLDNMVIPRKARHVDLAHEFINFMLDPENALKNASVVGYCTPIESVYETITNYESDPSNPDNTWLESWAYGVNKYYPIPEVGFQGTIMTNISRSDLNKMTTMIQNVKIA